jgi:DNA repair photolyase
MRAVDNPPNPWATSHVEWLGEPPAERPRIFEEEARSLIQENDSPDVGFRFSANPYRGCMHACAYCYARPTHQYLDFGAGSDFDLKIVVKVNAPELLARELQRPSWGGEFLTFSGVTDCYQPLEASYALTRRCLELCLRYRNPVAVVTKGTLVRRDADLLARLAQEAAARVYVSVPFADDAMARALEPGAPLPSQRLETLRVLSAAGVPTGVAVAPIIPGLTDREMPEILERARQAGATRAFHVLLRLPAEVRPVFEARLLAALPSHAARVLGSLESMRDGRRNESRFGARMRGTGPRWQLVEDLFRVQCQRLGLATGEEPALRATFRRPRQQGELFGR